MKKGRKASPQAETVRQMHGAVMDSLDAFLGAITVQDLLSVMRNGGNTDELLAAAFEAEAARLRG